MEINRFRNEAMPHIRALIELNNRIKSMIYESATLGNKRSNPLYRPAGAVDTILDKILVSQDIVMSDIVNLLKQQASFREILDVQSSNAWRIRLRKLERLQNISNTKQLNAEFFELIDRLNVLVKSDPLMKSDAEIAQIPKQIPAPIRTKIVNERLISDNEKQKTGSLADITIEKALQSIKNTLEIALGLLSNESNCDKRVVPSCKPLLHSIDVPFEDLSIINVGYNARIFSKILSDFPIKFPILY